MTDNDFYKLQNQWSQIYFRDDNDSDKEKVAWVQSIIGQSRLSILELGAGGGQFSVAACKAGHVVTAVEIEQEFVKHIKKLASLNKLDNLRIVEGDFLQASFDQRFDLVCYWDGFGVGSDDQQNALLLKISSWLSETGSALIDVFTPWYWATKALGVKQKFGKVNREYGFDFESNCLLDTWELAEEPDQKTAQRLRCYSPADLILLLKGLDLEINAIYPGGSVDYENGIYEPEVTLGKAMSYTAHLVLNKSGNNL